MKTLDKKYDRKYLPKEFNPKNENELKSIYQNLSYVRHYIKSKSYYCGQVRS